MIEGLLPWLRDILQLGPPAPQGLVGDGGGGGGGGGGRGGGGGGGGGDDGGRPGGDGGGPPGRPSGGPSPGSGRKRHRGPSPKKADTALPSAVATKAHKVVLPMADASKEDMV